MAAAEVGHSVSSDPDISVGDLPEQEIADAHFAARANQQIGIGLPAVYSRLDEAIPASRSSGLKPDSIAAPRGIDDLGTGRVIERDVEDHPVFFASCALRRGSSVLSRGERLDAAIMLKRMLFRSRVSSSSEVALEQHHQGADFAAGRFQFSTR
jgi:hypothetical protein